MLSSGRLTAVALFVTADGAAGLKTKTPQDIRILNLAEPVAAELGLEIVRVRVLSGKRARLQIMADRPDNAIDVEDCARLSRGIFPAPWRPRIRFPGEFDLEVSSPGIDRPLTTLPNYARWKGT